MRKLFRFILILIPAYIIAMLLYTFIYQPDKTNFDKNVKSVIYSGVEIVKDKIGKLNIDKKLPTREEILSKLPKTDTDTTNKEKLELVLYQNNLSIYISFL